MKPATNRLYHHNAHRDDTATDDDDDDDDEDHDDDDGYAYVCNHLDDDHDAAVGGDGQRNAWWAGWWLSLELVGADITSPQVWSTDRS